MTDAERINQLADELMAYQPLIDIPFERFNDIALAIVTLGYVSKEEVENLKENRNGWRNRAWNDEKTIFELQEQMDKLTHRIDSVTKYHKHNKRKLWAKAVEKTAKKIFNDIIESFVFAFIGGSEDYEKGYIDALQDYDKQLRDFAKEYYNVEVKQ